MKDISSVLVMSRHETDDPAFDDMRLEIDCTPTAEVFQTDTQTSSFVSSYTVSVMDWAECLIEMTVAASDFDSMTSPENIHEHETTTAEQIPGSIPVAPTPASPDDNSLHNDQQLIAFDLTNSHLSLEGDLPADEVSYLATNNSTDQRYSDVLDPRLVTSSMNTVLTGQHKSLVSSCIPTSLMSDFLKHTCPDDWTGDHPTAKPHQLFPDIFDHTQYSMCNFKDSCSDQLQCDAFVSSSDVGFESGTSSTLSISSTQPTTTLSSDINTSLQTPTLESCPNFTDNKTHSVTCCSLSRVSDNYLNAVSPTESHLTETAYDLLFDDPSFQSSWTGHPWNSYDVVTGDLNLSEIGIAAVEVVSSDLCEIPEMSSRRTVTPDMIPHAQTLYLENTVPCSLSGGNTQADVDELTPVTSGASCPHPSEPPPVMHSVEVSTTQAVCANSKLPNILCQEFPPYFTVTCPADDVSNSQQLTLDASPLTSTMNTQGRLETWVAPPESNQSRKEVINRTVPQNLINKCSPRPRLCTKTVSKRRYEHTQSKLSPCTHTTPSMESADLPPSRDLHILNNHNCDNRSNTTHVSTSTSSLVSQNDNRTFSHVLQTDNHSLFLLNCSSEITSDALLTPSDLYNPLLLFESYLLLEPTHSDPHGPRPVSGANQLSLEDSDVSNTLPTTSASSTDGDGALEPLIADKVKDTLRSKLKARQETTVPVSSHTWTLAADSCGQLSTPATGKCFPSGATASVATWSSGQSISSRHNWMSPQSSASCMSPDESTQDNDTMNDDDDDDGNDEADDMKMRPVHRKRKHDEKEDKEETAEESEGSRLAKREKNRLAAQKCRMRRRDKIDTLTQQVQKLEQKQERIKIEVDKLEIEREQLEEMLRLHSFVCKRKL